MYQGAKAQRSKPRPSRISVIVTVSVSLTVVLGFTALAIDVAYLHTALAEMRAAADRGGDGRLPGALLTDERLKGAAELQAVMARGTVGLVRIRAGQPGVRPGPDHR